MKYKAIIPFIPSMGSVSPMVCTDYPSESKEENLLWHLNKMREHDGLRPLKNIPRGVKWETVE
jgi:hypothetical protein